VRRSIKWHETFPRKTPVDAPRSHDEARRPRPIWSQLPVKSAGGSRDIRALQGGVG
jgi:hypothetical protein